MPEADPEKLIKMLEAELAAKRVKGSAKDADRINFRIWSLAAILIISIAALMFLHLTLSSLRPAQEPPASDPRQSELVTP